MQPDESDHRMDIRRTPDLVEYIKVPCLMIYASAWMDRADFREWVEKSDVAHWPGDTDGDVFVTYDHGEGSDNPDPMMPGPGIMPMWVWDEIKAVVQHAGLSDGYCIVRLMGA